MMPMARVRVPPGKIAGEALYEYALRALGRRAHTLAELEAKLRRRSVAEEDVEFVVGRLREHGYLDDTRVAEVHSSVRRGFHLLGRKRVLDELERRGVDEATAEGAVSEAYEDCDESELAKAFLRRKLGASPEGGAVRDPKRLARLYRSLARAGFDPSAARDALRDISGNAEALEALEERVGEGN